MVTRRKHRSWSDDEKREICQQTTVSGVFIALFFDFMKVPQGKLGPGGLGADHC